MNNCKPLLQISLGLAVVSLRVPRKLLYNGVNGCWTKFVATQVDALVQKYGPASTEPVSNSGQKSSADSSRASK